METIAALIRDMMSSTIQGIFGVTGIVLFFLAIVISAIWRISQLMEEDKQGHH
ncbi:MAG: hypothetical protein ACOCVU_03395 [Desulfohalobiaceae bacterium]